MNYLFICFLLFVSAATSPQSKCSVSVGDLSRAEGIVRHVLKPKIDDSTYRFSPMEVRALHKAVRGYENAFNIMCYTCMMVRCDPPEDIVQDILNEQ